MRLRLVNLKKKFVSLRGSIVAVDKVNLEIRDREFFVLLGPSGCGKSTVLNLIAGLEKANGGEIWFDDRLVASAEKKVHLAPKERNVAMVFQSYALYPHLNVFENTLRIMKGSSTEVKEAVRRAASRLEISDLLAAKPAELSGGQRQRVAIARAIVRHPDVFLLDEPLSNLDAQLRASTRTELKRLQRGLGITTVYVTHDQVEAMTLGDRIAVLREGKIEQIGTPEELYERPINTFVGTFIGSPPMNLLKATLVKEEENLYIFLGDKKLKMPGEKAACLKSAKPGPCVFGIRPEHIRLDPGKGIQQFKVKVDSVEPMGREILLHMSFADQEVSVLTSKAEFKDAEVCIQFDLPKSHIFAS